MISNLNKRYINSKTTKLCLNYYNRLYSSSNSNNNNNSGDTITNIESSNDSPSFKRIDKPTFRRGNNNNYNNNNNQNRNNNYNNNNNRNFEKKSYNNNNKYSNNNNNYNNNNNQIKKNEKYKKEFDYYELKEEGVYGINPVWIALSSENRTFNTLYICKSILNKLKELGINLSKIENTKEEKNNRDYYGKDNEDQDIEDQEDEESFNRYNDRKNLIALKEIIENAFKFKIPVISINKSIMNSFSKSRPHQGVVLDASPLTLLNIDTLPNTTTTKNKKNELWLVLDELWDPQNVGAIIRSCSFFGVDGVVLSDKNSSPITSTASKASSGAVESYLIHRSESIYGFLKSSKINGWRVIGTSLSDTVNGNSCLDITEVKLDKPTILLIGNEGFGLKSNILELCDQTIKITGGNDKIDSLNASVTSAILIHSLLSSSKNK